MKRLVVAVFGRVAGLCESVWAGGSLAGASGG
jgi:hypothetical protein